MKRCQINGPAQIMHNLNHKAILRWAATLTTITVAVAAPASEKKPNIVHIVADDLGWKDVGFNGCTDIKTPNIDKLAARGAKFTQFYVQPMPTPTRAYLMTGRYPWRYGLQTIVIPALKHGKPLMASESGKGPEMVGGGHSITDEGFGDNDDHP
jgi:hypothetical protein